MHTCVIGTMKKHRQAIAGRPGQGPLGGRGMLEGSGWAPGRGLRWLVKLFLDLSGNYKGICVIILTQL